MQVFSVVVEFPELADEYRERKFRMIRACSMVVASRKAMHKTFQDPKIRGRRPGTMVVTVKRLEGVRLE
jgi:hypothetical protein